MHYRGEVDEKRGGEQTRRRMRNRQIKLNTEVRNNGAKSENLQTQLAETSIDPAQPTPA